MNRTYRQILPVSITFVLDVIQLRNYFVIAITILMIEHDVMVEDDILEILMSGKLAIYIAIC
jgi:hypothetical protein